MAAAAVPLYKRSSPSGGRSSHPQEERPHPDHPSQAVSGVPRHGGVSAEPPKERNTLFPTHSYDGLPLEVLDGICQVLMSVSDPGDRASVIHRLVLEIYEAVQSLHLPEVADDELLSISPLLTEALRHQRRMAAVVAVGGTHLPAGQDVRRSVQVTS